MSDYPYPGLRPFKSHENDIFCGRDEFIEQLTQKLGEESPEYHLIAVVGDSGCGKSSLVLAGLLHRLRLDVIGGCEHWRRAVMRPGSKPFFHLAKALLDPGTNEDSNPALEKEIRSHYRFKKPDEDLQHRLQREGDARSITTILPDNHNFLLVVDQFEELFHSSNEQETRSFIQWLLASSRQSGIYVVITMRSEFLDACAKHNNLIEAINRGIFQIPYLNREQLREAIELPARMFEGEVAPALVKRLLTEIDEMGDSARPDHLPLLEHALQKMWQLVENDPIKILTEDHYKKIKGNLATILSEEADALYQPAQSKERIEILFRRLSQKDEKGNYTRRAVPLREIRDLTGGGFDFLDTVYPFWKSHGFLSVDGKEENEELSIDDTVNIRHESIIRQWQILRNWVDEEYEWQRGYRRWEDAAQQWKLGKGELRRGRYLTGNESLVNDLQRLYPKPSQLKAWASRYGRDFDLAWEFFEKSLAAREEEQQQAEEAKRLEIERQTELKWAKEREEVAQRERNAAEKEKKIAQTLFKLAGVSALIIALVAVWGFWERNKAIQVEQMRTVSLFDSYRQQAALVAENQDYARAQQILQKTYGLDGKIALADRQSRNLLGGFLSIVNQPEALKTVDTRGMLHDLALSPDAKVLMAVGEQGLVASFEAETGKLLKYFDHPDDHSVRALAFHPQQAWVATAGDDKIIRLWKQTGELWKEWPTEREVWALASNGNFLASGGAHPMAADGSLLPETLKLWNTQTDQPELIPTPVTCEGSINSLAFNPQDPNLLAVGCNDNNAVLWRIGEESPRYLKAHAGPVQEVRFSPQGDRLATASDDKTVRIWEVATGKSLAVLSGHRDKVFTLGFLAQGHYLVSGGADASLRIWDAQSGVTVRVLQGHRAFVNGVAIRGEHLFTSSTDQSVKQWDLQLPHQYMLQLPAPPTATAISAQADQVAVGFETGLLEIRSLPEGKLLHSFGNIHNRDVQRVAFGPEDRWLAAASLDGRATVWKKTGEQWQLFGTLTHEKGVNAVAFAPDGRRVLTASYDGQLGQLLLDTLDTPQPSFTRLYSDQEMNAVTWDNSGQWVLTTTDTGAQLWNQTDWQSPSWQQAISQYPSKKTTFWGALSPDHRQVALVGDYFKLKMYPQESEPYDLPGHDESVIRALFTPGGQQLLTVGGDNKIKAWDLRQRTLLFSLSLPSSAKDSVWDFDFRCPSQQSQTELKGCWLATPLSVEQRVVLYQLGN